MLNTLVTLLLMYAAGYLGYIVFKYFRVPAPAIIGAAVTVGALNIFGMPFDNPPVYIRILLQVIVGVMVGMRFNKEDIRHLKDIFYPACIIVAWMIGGGIGAGILLSRFTGISLGTSLLSTTPGGMTEMSILAISYGLNVPMVLVFQFMRIIGVYVMIPAIASFYKSSLTGGYVRAVQSSAGTATGVAPEKEKVDLYRILITLAIGGVSGYASWYSGIPAGAFLGSMAVTGALRSAGAALQPLPRGMLLAAQVGLGGLLGLRFTPEVGTTLGSMLLLSIVISVVFVLNSLVLSFVIHSIFKWDIITCILSCAPAGLTQMSAIALDMDADAVKVGLIHILRLITIVMVAPYIIFNLYS